MRGSSMKQTIIKTLLCVGMALVSLNASAQVKAFEKYADMKDVTYVYISKYMLAMAGKNSTPSIPNVDTKALYSKLTGIQIIHSENKGAQTKLKNDIKSSLVHDKYELLMQINEDSSNVNIYYSVKKQQSVVIMLVEENNKMTTMVFSGKFTLNDVMKMAQ